MLKQMLLISCLVLLLPGVSLAQGESLFFQQKLASAQASVSLSYETLQRARHQRASLGRRALGLEVQQSAFNLGSGFAGAVFWLYIGVPYAVLDLIPLIGNIVMRTTGASAGALRGWGIAGVITGSVGTLFEGIVLALVLGDSQIAVPLFFAVLGTMLLHITNIVLGALNIVKAGQVGRLSSHIQVAPWVSPTAQGQLRVGLLLEGRF